VKPSSPNVAQGSVAATLAVLVLALTLLAASPLLHSWLHGADCGVSTCRPEARSAGGKPHPFAIRVAPERPAEPPAGGESQPARPPHSESDGAACAVTLFASGVEPMVAPENSIAPVGETGRITARVAEAELPLEWPGRLPPAVGPPGS
jgi:hypothetical protein